MPKHAEQGRLDAPRDDDALDDAPSDADDGAHPRVSYHFLAAVDPGAGWQVVRMQLEERVSAPYTLSVWLLGGPDADPSQLLGTSATLEVRRGRRVRPVHGIVSSIARRPRAEGCAVELTLVPALRALGFGSDCRIFAGMSVPDVVEAVLTPALAAHGRRFVRRLRRSDYAPREYLVQYRESDLAFVERVLAEEGIWYHFEHPRGRAGEVAELLCLVDDNAEAHDAALGPAGARLPLALDRAGLARHEAVSELVMAEALGSSGVAVRAYNWTHPRVHAEASAPASGAGPRAQYVPDEVHFTQFAEGRYAGSEASAEAQRIWERSHGREAGARGVGNLIALATGQQIEVRDPAGDGATVRWIVTQVEAVGRDAAHTERSLQHLEDYQCTFACVRADRPLRPAAIAKPRVLGAQTGRVVGPDGTFDAEPGRDDLHVDAHGRVQVKLAWDRSTPGAPGATNTCFLRVAQPWAGRGFGVSFTPRVGMEVVVSFLDGDPDRPLVTGCVYNGLNEPPFALPERKSLSGIRTQSTPSGEGHNELCFDDTSGRERVVLHAQRDHIEEVGHDQRVKVGGSRTTQVSGFDLAYVSGDLITVLKGAERFGCAGDSAVTVAGEQVVRVGKRASARYDDGRTVQVARSDRLAVTHGGNKDVHVEGSYHITADRELKLTQDAARLVMRDSALHATTLGPLQLETPGFDLTAKADGSVAIRADRSLVIEVGKARVALFHNGNIEISGLQCEVRAGASCLTLAPDGATLSGPIAKLTGTALSEITAPLVKIN